MSATIKYKGSAIASITTDSSKTLKTSGKYCEGDIVVENVQDGGITPSGNKAITATTSTQTGIDVTNYATVSVAPTPSETKSVTTNGDVTPSSGKLLSKVMVNVPTGTARDSSDLTVSGATVNVPAGLYSSAASKSVASGTAGTPTASKGAVSNNSVTVTPSVTNTTGYITGGTKTGTGVTVSASELVSGNKALTPSTTAQANIDVKNYATASVAAITKELLASLDTDFVAENIKKDVDLFGLLGTLEAGGGNTMFGRKFEYGSITPADDIAEDYVINFQEGFCVDVLTPPYYNFVLWCENTDAGGTNTPNSSWMWLIMGRRGLRAGFSYGQYHSASGSVSNASYAGVIGDNIYSSRVKIYCTSSKKLIAGRTYNWIAVSN